MFTIILNTFREALAKKITIFYFSIFALVLVVLLFFVNTNFFDVILGMSEKESAITDLQVQFLAFPGGLNWMYTFTLIFCLISSSSFIPSMLEKGNIDLLLSKPISRTSILIAKYVGTVVFVTCGISFFLGSAWLIISIKSNVWNYLFLFSIIAWSISFAVMYSITFSIGLFTQNSVISILVNVFLLGIIFPVLSIRESVIYKIINNDVVRYIFDFFYYILPKPGEINDIAISFISHKSIAFWKGGFIENLNIFEPSWMSLISSLLFMVVVFSYSAYYFSKKDY